MSPALVRIALGTLQGAAAGVAATVPMSLAMAALRRPLSPIPPREIVDRTLAAAGAHPTPATRDALTVAGHFAYGAACGAVYGALERALPLAGLPWPVKGAVYGLLVWAGSYAGWLPAVGLQPPPDRDKPGRQPAIVAAHLVYGVATAALARPFGTR